LLNAGGEHAELLLLDASPHDARVVFARACRPPAAGSNCAGVADKQSLRRRAACPLAALLAPAPASLRRSLPSSHPLRARPKRSIDAMSLAAEAEAARSTIRTLDQRARIWPMIARPPRAPAPGRRWRQSAALRPANSGRKTHTARGRRDRRVSRGRASPLPAVHRSVRGVQMEGSLLRRRRMGLDDEIDDQTLTVPSCLILQQRKGSNRPSATVQCAQGRQRRAAQAMPRETTRKCRQN
jgi:hypothetical protein